MNSNSDWSKLSTSGPREWSVHRFILSTALTGSFRQPFAQITSLTDVQEGTIVRAITRLDETCREVRDAARIVGNSDLFTKMEKCQLLIRRDIVFVASRAFLPLLFLDVC